MAESVVIIADETDTPLHLFVNEVKVYQFHIVGRLGTNANVLGHDYSLVVHIKDSNTEVFSVGAVGDQTGVSIITSTDSNHDTVIFTVQAAKTVGVDPDVFAYKVWDLALGVVVAYGAFVIESAPQPLTS